LTNVDFEDITAAGAAAPFTGSSIGNCGGNTSITESVAATVYWVHDSAATRSITDGLWFTASGGATPARFPLPQDTAVFDANSFPTTGKTVSNAITGLRLPYTLFTGVTH